MDEPEDDLIEPISGSKEIGALAHLYRAEVYRSTIWRQRLDMTTNWAVVSTGIALSVSFASAQASPLPIALVGFLTMLFLALEARRYRYFTVWKFRARLLELAIMVPILKGQGADIPMDRGTALSDDYIKPSHRITALRALGHRLRRNYLWIFIVQYIAFVAKVAIHPVEALTFGQVVERAHVGPLSGTLVLGAGLLLQLVFVGITIWTWRADKRDKSTMSDYLKAVVG